MNEEIFKSILARAVNCEFAEFDNAPEHKFSLKHRLAMKCIFARFERNARKLHEREISETRSTNEYKHHLNLKQRLIIVTVIIILMTFLVGCVIIFVSGNFSGTVYPDNTQLNINDLEDCPKTIEYNYTLASVPDGFELTETNSSPIHVYTLYTNSATKQTISLHQWVKTSFDQHYNTERYNLEVVTINNADGLCIDFSDDISASSLVVWDNGDYVMEFMADFDKDHTLNLANLNKINKR
ncbi:MAG: DUF4367 domain-containing protein [Oscillospiraceae bacterium]|nr:DUF4367 domain-containing protein [Oscillospiraceae bacterium]